MRTLRTMLSGHRFLILSLAALCLLFTGCDNPFDPLEDSDEIMGLTYVDFATEWAKWDSDPYSDGLLFTPEYLNEYGDSLEFSDKPHDVQIEFYENRLVTVGTTSYTTYGNKIWTYKTTYRNTSDNIRIPVELYLGALKSAGVANTGVGSTAAASVYILLRVYPPKDIPQHELVVGYPDNEVYTWEVPVL